MHQLHQNKLPLSKKQLELMPMPVDLIDRLTGYLCCHKAQWDQKSNCGFAQGHKVYSCDTTLWSHSKAQLCVISSKTQLVWRLYLLTHRRTSL